MKKITAISLSLIFVAVMLIGSIGSSNFVHGITYYSYTIYGPYYDTQGVFNSGTAVPSSTNVNCIVFWANATVYQFTQTGAQGLANTPTVIVSDGTPITELQWNASSALNLTRTIFFQPTILNQQINLYIPSPSAPSFVYTFTITDFVGMTGATTGGVFLESSISNGLGTGTNMVEQENLGSASNPQFVMQEYSTYTLTFICDQGSYSQQFTAEGTYTNSLPVLAGNFPLTNSTYPVADAERFNSSAIAVTYSDPSYSTQWLYISITHQFGSQTINDYTQNQTGNSQTLLWNSASATTDYTTTIQASILNSTSAYGNNPEWIFTIPQNAPANPFYGAFDWLGQYTPTMPYTPTGWTNASGGQWTSSQIAELLGMALILIFLGIGSFRSSGPACITAWILSGILIYLGWWGNGLIGAVAAIPAFALCGFVAIFIQLSEGKDTARET
jgi:hypothetical protein